MAPGNESMTCQSGRFPASTHERDTGGEEFRRRWSGKPSKPRGERAYQLSKPTRSMPTFLLVPREPGMF
jgi:hypothetical protein